MKFQLHSEYAPAGDQPYAIERLTEVLTDNNFAGKNKYQTLLGVTGSGKTFTVANVIQNTQKPALIVAPNKTLAAQLFNEFKEFFPENSVEFFISYYDYYQPESYIPSTDTFIEKTAKINQEIDRLRHSATQAIFEKEDVIVIASVSAIYGLGAPENYFEASMEIAPTMPIGRDDFMRELIEILFERNDFQLDRGFFRCRGDIVDIWPTYDEELIRIEFFGDEIDRITRVNPTSGKVTQEIKDSIRIYPAKHYVASRETIHEACEQIEKELEARYNELKNLGKDLEATRLNQRTRYDIEMMKEVGYCNGIENYSRIVEGREPGSAPQTLIDYFIRQYGDNWLCIMDESHISLPQVRGMYNGDASRKQTLINYGFRLPCARDNRPLKFDEFLGKTPKILCVSATPADFEREHSQAIVEQIVRPTGLVDPVIHISPVENQIDDLIERIHEKIEKGERILVTTLTKKSAEDLSEYLDEIKIKAKWLHSDLKALERIKILKGLRDGDFDVLIGVNLLREGLDLPEVSLVAILDADKEGFLRSTSSLIQTVGRAARNACGEVVLYADKQTQSIQVVLETTENNRLKQLKYNEENNIIPATIKKKQTNKLLDKFKSGDGDTAQIIVNELVDAEMTLDQLPQIISKLEEEMLHYAQELEFERAAEIRDQLDNIKKMMS